jgi:tRNA (mo5U34)-methyltransferase
MNATPSPEPLDIAALAERAIEFRKRLDAAKHKIAPKDFEWYPYDSLSNLHTLDRLLTSPYRSLWKLASGKPILDIGCADGDLALFLASFGHRILAVDNPITNYNSMRGLRALNRELGGLVEIQVADLDGPFQFKGPTYGLAFLLGVLYHLKNPYRMLDSLSRCAEYAVISTSITAYAPGLYESVVGTSIAYLADVYEINRDSTNYWLLSDAGFRRLLQRTNWEICDYLLIGTPGATGAVAEQRAFTLVRSRFAGQKTQLLFGKGWHEPEQAGWRWTQRRFAVRFESPLSGAPPELSLTVFVPEALIEMFGGLTLFACANGVDLPPESFSASGSHSYRRPLTNVPLFEGDIRIDFSLNHALPADAGDPRERGIVVIDLQMV